MSTSRERDAIVIDDCFTGYSPASFNINPAYNDYLDHVLIPHGFVVDRSNKVCYYERLLIAMIDQLR